jgi:DNA replication initiation complex subunit (GINS family)
MITFEKIRDLERIEKTEKALQKLPEGFLTSLQEYLSKKKQTSSDILEIDSIKNTIKRLWEIRERKIVELALASARTGIKPENLTPEEQQLFNEVKNKLLNFRTSLFARIQNTKDSACAAFKQEQKPKPKLFLVKEDIPSFIGPDMKTYELKKGSKHQLPKKVAELLLKQEKIEKI